MQKPIKEIIKTEAQPTSIKRGKELYRRGDVQDLRYDVNTNSYTARIKGTHVYQVSAKLNNDAGKNDFTCTCPYDWGGLCKHQVAILLAVEDLFPLPETRPASKINVKKPKPTLSPYNELSPALLKELVTPSILYKVSEFKWTVYITDFDRETMKAEVSHESFWTSDHRKVTFNKEKDVITTHCTCGYNGNSFCVHIAAFLNFHINQQTIPTILRVFDPVFYQEKIINGLKLYGLSDVKNPEEVIAIEPIKGILTYNLLKKYRNLVPVAQKEAEAFTNYFKANLFVSRTQDFQHKFIEEGKMAGKKDGFGILFNYNPDNLSHFSIQAIMGRLAKKEDRFVGNVEVIDLKILPILEPHQQEVVKQLIEIDNETTLLHSFDEDKKFLAHSRIIPHLNKLIHLIGEKDLTFLRKESYSYRINNKSLEPILFSKSPAKVEFELSTLNDFVELTPFLVLGDKKITLPWKEMDDHMVLGVMFQLEGFLYLIENADTLSAISFFQDQGGLKTPLSQYDKFIHTYVMPLSKNFKVDMSKAKALKIKEIKAQPSKRQLYFSEMGDFILLTPMVEYQEGHLQNILEKGNPMIEKNKQYISLIRDETYETNLYQVIKKIHPKLNKQFPVEFFHLKAADLLENDWFLSIFEELQKENIEVFGFDKLKNFKYNPYPAKVNTSISSGIDWFEVSVDIAFGNMTVSLSEVKKAVLKKEKYVKLSDGSLGILPKEWLEKFERMFRQGEVKGDLLKISSRRFMIIDNLFSDIENEDVRLQLAEKKRRLAEFSTISTVTTPKGIKATLRDYQREGLNWMNFLEEYQWGGILADDMGLGKTLQVLSFLMLQKTKSKTPNLIVVPTSLVFNWEIEINKFCPSLKVFFHYGPDRQKNTKNFKGNHLIITTYGTMLNDIEFLKDFEFNYIILDESQAIKNMQSLRFKAARLLVGQNKLALTGTPIENNTFDLYAQMQFVNPGLLGSAKSFKEQFSQPIDRDNDPVIAAELKKLLTPFMIRRTKEQVATELPPKTEEVLFCSMSAKQRAVYDAYRHKYRSYLLGKIEEDGLENSKIYVLEGLTKLRQICDSPAILSDNEDYGDDSVKIDELLRNIREKTGHHKIIVFSQFVKMLHLIKKRLEEENICFEYLDGKCSAKARKKSVEVFQENEDCRVFLISLKAGGTGLNLTAADYVFLVDPWWNPAVENQAIDRCYRIGQTKRVFAYRMICKDSVEEKILEHQRRKQAVANEVVQAEENFMKKLTFEDIKSLFE